jgi:hypothetical protein
VISARRFVVPGGAPAPGSQVYLAGRQGYTAGSRPWVRHRQVPELLPCADTRQRGGGTVRRVPENDCPVRKKTVPAQSAGSRMVVAGEVEKCCSHSLGDEA